MRKFFVVLFGSFFYTGFFAFAPASFASLVWLALYLFVPGGAWLASPIALCVAAPIAVLLSREMEMRYGEDASCIVIDEFVGMQVSLLMIKPSITVGLVGLLLFRIFDILKPFPAGASQRLRGGIGVVMDDITAGIYTRLVLLLLMNVFNMG